MKKLAFLLLLAAIPLYGQYRVPTSFLVKRWVPKQIINPGGGGGTCSNALTMNNSGSGAASGATFDCSAAKTISYNTVLPTASATFATTPSSANLRALLTDESGTGAALFAGGNIGAATGTSLTLGAGGALCSSDTGAPCLTFGTNSETFNQPLTVNSSGSSNIAIGTDNSAAGTLTTSSGSSNFHNIWGSAATMTGTNQINGFTVVPTTGHLVGVTVSSTTAQLIDSGVVTANVVNASSPGSGIAHFAGSTQTVTSSAVVDADVSFTTPAIAGATATTQAAKNNTTKVATTAYVDRPVDLPAAGTSVSLTAPSEIYICSSTCTVTPPVPAAGYQFCVLNGDNVTTVITLAALGSSARYENQARTAYGTAGTGTLVMGGAPKDQVCLIGLDSTHYLTVSVNGTAVVN